MKLSILGFWLVLLLSCDPVHSNQSITWNVDLKKQGIEYELVSVLCSSYLDTVVVIDYKSFTQSCPENDMTRIGSVIIENKDGQVRNYSKLYFDENERKDMWDDNCMFAWVDSFHLKSGIPVTFDISVPYLSDLKVTSRDTKIRLHYFNHRFPDDVRSVDWGIHHLTSNWVRISYWPL